MLWARSQLLILHSIAILCLLQVFPPLCSGQIGEIVAPWRIVGDGEVELGPASRLNLNTASEDDLLQISGMTPELASDIVRLREVGGLFEDVEDLKRLSGINDDIFELISPYLEVRPEDETASVSFISRCQFDQPASEDVESAPYRLGEKFTLGHTGGVILGLAFDKDPGEKVPWDHSSFSLEIPFSQEDGEVILGDYLVGAGQGLIVQTRRNFGLSFDRVGHLRIYPHGLKSYHGWDENIALRGAGVLVAAQPVQFFAWGSQRYRDAYLNEDGQITSIDDSGLHRTDSEQERQDACLEDAWGLHVSFSKAPDQWTVGSTLSSVRWDRRFLFQDEPLSRAFVAGADVQLKWGEANLGFESGWDDRGENAVMATVMMESELIRGTAAVYHADAGYFSPLASALDFDLGEVNNREGVYSNAKVKVSNATLAGFVHLYKYPERLPGESWGGQDFFIGGEMPIGNYFGFSANSRWTQEEESDTCQKASRWRGSCALLAKLDGGWRLKSRLYLAASHETMSLGRMIILGSDWKKRIRQNLRAKGEVGLGFYQADDYAVRLYWLEYDESRSLRARPLWNTGAILQIKAGLRHTKWGSLQVVLLWDRPKTGSDRLASRTLTFVYRY